VNSTSNPAPRGSIVVVYATGEGQTDPNGVNGFVTDGVLRKTIATRFHDRRRQNADVLYAGSAPGLISGVLQVNLRVPVNVSGSSAVPVVLTVGRQQSARCDPGLCSRIRPTPFSTKLN